MLSGTGLSGSDRDDNVSNLLDFFFLSFLSLHNAIRRRGHSRHVALSSNPSMLIDESKR